MPMPADKKYTADEFLAMELSENCELINGEIFIRGSDSHNSDITETDMAPAPSQLHQEISSVCVAEIFGYIKKYRGSCKVFHAPFDVKLDDQNIVQPDIFVACDESKLDGQRHNGAPDWTVEILSPSSTKRDYSDKLFLYKKHGVREYWIIDPEARRVIVYPFEDNTSAELYTFEDAVPVHIYKNTDAPLSIRLADYF